MTSSTTVIYMSNIDQKMYSHVESCIDDYSRTHLSPPGDVIFRLYLYSYEKKYKEKAHLCAPSHFLKTSSYSDIWSNVLLSTGLADIYGIEQQDYKLNISEALNSIYACLVLIGKYVLCKPKIYKKADSVFWHTLDRMLRAYKADRKASSSPHDKVIIAAYLKLNYHPDLNDCPKWLISRKDIPEDELLVGARKREIISDIQKISSEFDALTNLDSKEKKSCVDTEGMGRKHIKFPPYLAPLIRGSYVSVHSFPYLPNQHLYTAYKKYQDVHGLNMEIDEKAYVCLSRIIRYKNYIKSTKKNTTDEDSFLENYFSVLYGTFESLRIQESHGNERYYDSSNISEEQFMKDKAYYYLIEKIYGYYLFRYETQLIKQKIDDLDSLKHEKRRLLKQALRNIFLSCAGVFARLQAAEEAINFIFEISNDPIDSSSKDVEEMEQVELYNKDVHKQNDIELLRIIDKFFYEHFAENEDKVITNLLTEIYPKKIESPIEDVVLGNMVERINKYKDKTGMMDYYETCFMEYYGCKNKVGCQEHIEDDSCRRKREDGSYKKILCWVIKKSVGDKWYNFFGQIE